MLPNNVPAIEAGRETVSRLSTSATQPFVPVTAVIGTDLPVFDLGVFERAANFLKPEAVASYLQTIAESGEALLRGLREPDALVGAAEELAEASHALAGSAGMFGFARLASLGRRFERAVQARAAETPVLAGGLAAALESTLQEIYDRMSAAVGAGLGLALSARLAASMGGRLAPTGNPGGGSVVWLEMPLENHAASLPAAPGASDVRGALPASTAVGALRLLVADDVAMNRDFASAVLRAAGHKVTCVESGEAAIAAVGSTYFDVVLMDVRMPGMDGLEATRRIRALEGARGQVPIVALTARAFAEQVAECRRAGMDDHLLKPFDPDTLLAAVLHATAAGHSPHDSISGVSMMVTGAAAPASPAIGAELPVFDRKAFDRTAIFLAPEAVASYLQTIAENGEPLLRGLWRPDALTRMRRELAEAALTLAGSAGMLGFERLASLGCHFERAILSNTEDAPALADGLSDALEATLQEIHDRMSVTLGAGLGLALSARLATLMANRRASGDSPDGASVMWQEMPLDNLASSHPAVASASDLHDGQPAPAATRPLNVLVVDDVAMNRDITGSFLRSAGHLVTYVEGGAAAVSAVAVTDFDVVLMDVRMPEIDGLEATRRIRALEGSRANVPIVAVTAQAFTEQVAECRKAGMNSHLPKPFDLDALIAAAVHATEARPLAWREH